MENGERRDVVSLTRFRRGIAWSLVVGVLVGAFMGAGFCEKRCRSLLKSIESYEVAVQTVDAASGEPIPISMEYVESADKYGLPRLGTTTGASPSEFEQEWIGMEPTYRVRISSDGYEPRDVSLDGRSTETLIVKLERAEGARERR